jgi:hypothetical protein
MSEPTLYDRIQQAAEWHKNATPAERKAMMKAQRESFVRAMTTPCEHGVLDFEQCGDCRALTPDDGEVK